MKTNFELPGTNAEATISRTGKAQGGCLQGMVRLSRPKPRTSYYHYSNESSQGALICETHCFPSGYRKGVEEYSCAYSDRIAGWDYKRFQRACEIGSGDQNWAYKLPTLPDDELRRFAQIALDLPVMPLHVRVVHHFNVSNGYSCPTVEAIWQPNVKLCRHADSEAGAQGKDTNVH